MSPPTGFELNSFVTDRFRVRPLAARDAKAMFAIKRDPLVTERYGIEPHKSIAQTKKWVRGCLEGSKKRASAMWVITPRTSRTPVGSCCLWNFDEGSHTAELGYELRRDYWGQRVMSEVLPSVLEFGFESLGLNRIEACPLADNAPSNKVLKGLGFSYEGRLRQRIFFRGMFSDQLYYGLIRGERPRPSER